MRKKGPAKKRKAERTSSLSKKMMLMALVIALTTSVLIGINVYYYMQTYSRETAANLAHDLLEQYGQKVDNEISEIEQIAFTLMRNENIVDLLRDEYTYASERYEQRLMVEDDLYAMTDYNKNVFGLYVFSRRQEQYYNLMSPSLRTDYVIEDEPWYDRAAHKEGQIVYREKDDKFIIPRDQPEISYIRYIYGFPDNTFLGVLEADLGLDFLEPLSQTERDNSQFSFFVTDAGGRVMYLESEHLGGDARNMIEELSVALPEQLSGEITDVRAQGEGMLVSMYRSDQTGWIYGGVMAVNTATSLTTTVATIIFFSIAIAFIFALLFSRYMGIKLFGPLQELRAAMYRIKENDLNVRAEVRSNDEIGDVALMFNDMATSLDNLINTVFALETDKKELALRKSESEMEALQSQINPHFLYNTLESISMTARINHDAQAQKMAIALGRLLRLSIFRGEKIVPVTEEIEHAQCYISIQKIRYEDKFEVSFDIEESVLELYTLKIVLQPVIENAIIHAIEPLAGTGQIHIKMRREECLKIYVRDNGVGMPPKIMNELNKRLAAGEGYGDNGSIGLTNTNRRIRLHFDSELYGLRILESSKKGTVVLITLPLLTGEDRKND